MKERIGYCGLDCEKCDAYLATIHDDQALREKTAKLWARLNQAPILPKTVFCEHMCAIRQCALKRGVTTCGGCPELESCQTVGAIFQNNSAARKNLEEAARLTNSNS